MALQIAATGAWLTDILEPSVPFANGLVAVSSFKKNECPFPEVVAVMEAAERYGADAVFFEAAPEGKAPLAQAFIYKTTGPVDDSFGELHRRLWSWGGVPLVYRVAPGVVHLFRCAHEPDFEGSGGPVAAPFKTWHTASAISSEPWWDSDRLLNGTLWDDPKVSAALLSRDGAAQKSLINAVWDLHEQHGDILPKKLSRRLLILTILISYLEAREIIDEKFYKRFDKSATRFFDVLPKADVLLAVLDELEGWFNGGVFQLKFTESAELRKLKKLGQFADVLDNWRSGNAQGRFWERYSFRDLPVELVSHIYQLFVADNKVSVYTPHFVVRLMVGEVLSVERMDRLTKNDEVILDGACGSGVFLVEAYKRLILHWRMRNGWKDPSPAELKQLMLQRIRGIDVEEDAVELASFSLCLALCDALDKEVIKNSRKLFPLLTDGTVEESCFFEAVETKLIKGKVGVVLGNPPFEAKMSTAGAKRALVAYGAKHGRLPNSQVALLFLHLLMEQLEEGGIISIVQPNLFLYGEQSSHFLRAFMVRWDLREVLDLISIRGLFKSGKRDPKVVIVVAEAQRPKVDRNILHATFRRSARAELQAGLDIDYYDLHWVPRRIALTDPVVWRCNLLGGGRVFGLVKALEAHQDLEQYAAHRDWVVGEGFIAGGAGKSKPASHIVGKREVPSEAITLAGIDTEQIVTVPNIPIEAPRDPRLFEAPFLLIREQMDLPHALWTDGHLTYRNQVVGFAAPMKDLPQLKQVVSWLAEERDALRAFTAATSTRLFCQKNTAIYKHDIVSLPFPESRDLGLTDHDRIVVHDLVHHYRDLIQHGSLSSMIKSGVSDVALKEFAALYAERINLVYKRNKLKSLDGFTISGLICQPFVFGNGKVDWKGMDGLRGRLDALLTERRASGLNLTRIVRLYDGPFIFLLKSDRLRYWLRSIALRDADETLIELAKQGF